MSYDHACDMMLLKEGVVISTMMKTPCLRYHDEFLGMWFEKADALIVKLPHSRVQELIENDLGLEFNFTKKPFKEWVLIPLDFEDQYLGYLEEALEFAKSKFKN